MAKGGFVFENPERLKLVEAMKLLDEHDALIRKASECGLDCQAQDLLSQALRQRVDAMQRSFLPPRRE